MGISLLTSTNVHEFPSHSAKEKDLVTDLIFTADACKKGREAIQLRIAEFWVAMPCGGCAKSVQKALDQVEGVKKVDINLKQKVLRISSMSSLASLTTALDKTRKKYRLIAYGLPEEMELQKAVAEFKGPNLFGVVRLSQISQETILVEAKMDGVPIGPSTTWAIHTYGDITQGASSTGPVYTNVTNAEKIGQAPPIGNLGTLTGNESGSATCSTTISGLNVMDVIGRSIVIHSDALIGHSRAAVLAMSASDGMQVLCACDGTVLWQSGEAACKR